MGENLPPLVNTGKLNIVQRLPAHVLLPFPCLFPEGCGCKLCPADWLPHKNKCYWVSKESKTWSESREDCSAKSSQMLVIQDKEEMAYVLSIPQLNLVWLGLRVPSPERKWTWVDGATFDETLVPLTDAADRESCGMIKGNRTISETCTAVAKWICEKVPLK
ncbi:killer cell lectin-like receptor subfamily F member 1 [Gopherus flavomarginatus]|uniref:killer cell lectin-like receptor subfamily F member 1 n=1 Tax=Gopherus flavomarginatus TaxID=286002 RepID=UPI0021CBC095|nr:killer cell lectin-like receptor subfamily F member 1 [Gopherus flavomarginatus]